MGSASTEADSILSSVWFQLVIALLVLSITLAPQIYHQLRQVSDLQKPDENLPSGKPSKRSKGKKNNKGTPELSLEDRLAQQHKELEAQQAELKQVREETARLKAEALAHASQSKADALKEAEAFTRRVFEEMNCKQEEAASKAQAEDAASLLQCAQAQALSMKEMAEKEAARVRKDAENEAASLRKLAAEEADMLRNLEQKKRQMEEEVRLSAARARAKMTEEVEALRKRAENEVQELRQLAAKETAAMFQRADQSVQQQHSINKPPKLPSLSAAPAPLNTQYTTLPQSSTPPRSPVVPQSSTPPRSPVVGSDRKVQEPPEFQAPITHNWTSGWMPPSQAPPIPPQTSANPKAPAGNGKPASDGARGEKGGMVPDMTQLVPYKLKLCIKFMQTGHCKRAAGCTYAHGEHEIGMQSTLRPQELQGVTLAEMNARKKGKNMVTPAAARAAAEESEQQAMRARAMAPEPVPTHAPAPQPTASHSQWEKPPRIFVPRTNPVKQQPKPDGLRLNGNKEPSPFLPLSPSLDEPWNRDTDGRAAMSWADSAITPPTAPQTP